MNDATPFSIPVVPEAEPVKSRFKGIVYIHNKWRIRMKRGSHEQLDIVGPEVEEEAAKLRDKLAYKVCGDKVDLNFELTDEERAELDSIDEDEFVAAVKWEATKRSFHRGSSRYKGVTYRPETRKWRAQINRDGKVLKLGEYHTEAAAALAYDRAMVERDGPDSLTNTKVFGQALLDEAALEGQAAAKYSRRDRRSTPRESRDKRRPRRSKAQVASVCALEAPLEASLASFGVATQDALYEAAATGVPTTLEALLDSSSERRNQLWGQMQKLGAGLADPTTRRAEEVRLQLAGSLAQEAFLQLRLAQLKGKQSQFTVTEEEPFIKEAKRKRGRQVMIDADAGIEEGYPSLKLDQAHSLYQAVEHHPPPIMMHYDPQQQHPMMLLHHGTHFGVMPHLPQALHHPQL